MKSPQKINGYIFGKAMKHMHQKPDKWGAFERQGTVKCFHHLAFLKNIKEQCKYSQGPSCMNQVKQQAPLGTACCTNKSPP